MLTYKGQTYGDREIHMLARFANSTIQSIESKFGNRTLLKQLVRKHAVVLLREEPKGTLVVELTDHGFVILCRIAIVELAVVRRCSNLSNRDMSTIRLASVVIDRCSELAEAWTGA